jgi:hypothetical protein
MKEDLELKQFRDLMPAPDHWEEGFGVKAMIGGLFVGLIMTPASMYMSLVMGGGIGSAAQWVTLILFIEVARRSFTVLKRPEIYVLYYMAGASFVGGTTPLLWNQFLAQSESIREFGLSNYIPAWVAPSDPDVLGSRNFFQSAWLVPIGLLAIGMFIQRVDHFGLGYVMYRLTSDVEKLAFPMAPVGAAGITALADASSGQDTWRWRTFSFGAVLGMGFAVIYMALPAVSAALLGGEPLSIFPLPFYDLTKHTQHFLPAMPMMLSFDLALVIVGMVLPFWAMVGSAIALLVVMIANPLLYKAGILHHWSPNVGAIATLNANYLDFFLSFGLGLTVAIALIGILKAFGSVIRKKRELDRTAVTSFDWKALLHPPPGRGDFSLWIALGIYVFSTAASITMAVLLLRHSALAKQGSALTPGLIAVLCFYGFVYTPFISYVSARLEGIIGQSVAIPFVREATFILSGYKGAAIWFAPFPAHNYGAQTVYFRKTELTGTKFWSMVKAEAFIFPVILLATLLFSQFIWKIAPVPSSSFPYAEKFWEMQAFQQSILLSSTMPGGEHGPFFEAFRLPYIAVGLGLALVLYGGLSFFGIPILMVYGIIRGLDQSTPMAIMPQFVGALLGRYYFAKRFKDNWPQYRIVFAAGYGCGVGLVMMLSLGLVFMTKSVYQSAF